MRLPDFMKRSLIPKLALAFVSMVIGIVLVEAAFRFITGEKVRLQGMWSANEVMGLQLAPGFTGSMSSAEFQYDVVINDHGMRDEPLDLDSLAADQPSERRALISGDSFVFGNGVNLADSLPKALERQLNAAAAPTTYRTFNAGMPGTGTFHHLHNLRRLAPLIRPHQVVHFFFVGDDWYGNRPRLPPGQVKKSFQARLRTSSALYRYLDRFLLSRSRSVDRYAIHYAKADPAHLARQDKVLGLIERIRQTTTEYGADLLICIIPRYVQVYDDAWQKAAFVYGLDNEKYNIQEPNRLLVKELSQRGFKTLDLLPALREEGQRRGLHFPVDGHWNVPGNTFVAEIVAAEMLSASSRAVLF